MSQRIFIKTAASVIALAIWGFLVWLGLSTVVSFARLEFASVFSFGIGRAIWAVSMLWAMIVIVGIWRGDK